MALPSNVSTGTVTGKFVVAVADGSDSDYDPDTYPVGGTVTFTPSVPYLPDPSGGVTILASAITGIFDGDGYLCTPDPDNSKVAGRRGVQLIATDDPDLSVTGWTWKVSYAFTPLNKVALPQVPPHDILVPSGGTVDLTSAVKVPSSTGVGLDQVTIIRADALQAAADADASADLAGSRATDAAGFASAAAGSATAAAGSVTTAAAVAQGSVQAAATAATAAVTAALPVQVPPIVAASLASDAAPAAAAASAVGSALTASDIVKGSDVRAARQVIDATYALPFTDASGYVSAGILGDGRWNFERTPKVKGQADVTMRPLNTTGWAIPFADPDGYVAGGIRPDGTAEFAKMNLSAATILQIANMQAGYTRSSRTKVSAIGDSLTAGFYGGVGGVTADAYPAKLQTLVPAGVTVYNIGVSGYTVDEEAVRVGALPVPLTVSGGSIPTTGPVTVTTTAVIGWRPTGTSRTIPGTLAGVAGTLTRVDSDTSFTFTRTTDGAAVPVSGSPVFVPDYAGHAGDTAIILLGRNDVTYSVKGADVSVADHVAKGIARIVNWLTPNVKQVLVVSTTTTTAETSGTSGYATVLDINARLRAAYPTRFLELRTYLVQQAIYDLGLTPTTADNTAMTGDTLPPSIMDGGTDNTHWSKATAGLVAAQINNYLTTRGWV